MNGTVHALTVFDDHSGSGPILVAAGAFSDGVLGLDDVGRWDGVNWAPLGAGFGRTVIALAVLEDGVFPRLFAGGHFRAALGGPGEYIAEWNGSSWEPLASGMDGPVLALGVFDDGGGPALYAGGEFTHAGGVEAYRIAKWNGTSWEALGNGLNGGSEELAVHALAVHDDGSGPALYVGGIFSTAGGVAAKHIARWNGSNWMPVGAGRDGRVFALSVFDDGSGGGPALYAGGKSSTGIDANRIGRWDGSTWAPLGAGLDDSVFSLAVFDHGEGPALHAGGEFTSSDGMEVRHVARWNGSSWAPLASGTSDPVFTLTVFDDATERGPILYAGGSFRDAGNVKVNGLGEWDGSRWSAGRALTSTVEALAVLDVAGAEGPSLYAAGGFLWAGGLPANYIARWDGSRWTALGTGLQSGFARALTVFDDGSGPALFVGGSFTQAGGLTAWHIARWDGSAWSPFGALAGSSVSSLVVFDDGNGAGPRLYAGVNGTTTNSRVSRWDGSSWTTLGSGMTNSVACVEVFDDGQGGGPALYAGGGFQLRDGQQVNNIARWNGTSWSGVGGGFSGNVEAFEVFDDGDGLALYAGGFLTSARGVPVNHIAKWDGVSWTPLGTGLDARVTALGVFDDGSGDGPVLLAGGQFSSAGGVPALGMAKWDGSQWSAFGNGTGPTAVNALQAFDDGLGLGTALYVGGGYVSSPSGDGFLSRWQGCLDTSAPVLSCPSSVAVLDSTTGPAGEFVSFKVTASDRDPEVTLVCMPPSRSFFPRGTTQVSCTATDSSGNQSTCEFPVTVQIRARRR